MHIYFSAKESRILYTCHPLIKGRLISIYSLDLFLLGHL
jgi:hypothetical protein